MFRSPNYFVELSFNSTLIYVEWPGYLGPRRAVSRVRNTLLVLRCGQLYRDAASESDITPRDQGKKRDSRPCRSQLCRLSALPARTQTSQPRLHHRQLVTVTNRRLKLLPEVATTAQAKLKQRLAKMVSPALTDRQQPHRRHQRQWPHQHVLETHRQSQQPRQPRRVLLHQRLPLQQKAWMKSALRQQGT